MSAPGAVPVLMYHSVGRPLGDWRWSFLTVEAETFEDHLRWLSRAGYRTADLRELHEHVSGAKLLPPRTVVLTFDDGYVDNWTYATPLLKRHGFQATVFVNPEFVDPRNVMRPTLEDMWEGRLDEDELEVRGFLSWPELEQMRDSGIWSVQSHLMTHTWYPVGPEVVDFHRPGDAHYWLDWNAHPEDKPFYLRGPRTTRVPWGSPVYAHSKSVEAARWHPDPRESEHLAGYAAAHGGPGLFDGPDWEARLRRELESFRERHPPPERRESPQEREERVLFELTESRRIIEERLGTPAEFLAWPGGGYDDEVLKLGRRIYRSVTLSSRDRSGARNRPGDDPGTVKRLGVPTIERGARLFYPGGRYLVRFLDEYRGVPLARKRRQMQKAACLVGMSTGLLASRCVS